jgi:hypothetical protein
MPPTTSTPHVQRAVEIGRRAGGAEIAVLRKGDELQIEIAADLPAHFEQRLDADQPVVAHVDMAADGEQPLRHREVAIAQGALDHRVGREQGLELAPQRDALEQRARPVEARHAHRQGGVEMEVRIDEGRRHQPPAGIDDVGRLRRDAAFHRDDAAVPAGDVEAPAAIGQAGVLTRRSRVMGLAPVLAGLPTRLDRASTGKRMLIDMEDRVNSAVEILDRLIAFASLPGETNLDLIAYIRDYLAEADVESYLSLDDSGTRANLHAWIGPRSTAGWCSTATPMSSPSTARRGPAIPSSSPAATAGCMAAAPPT